MNQCDRCKGYFSGHGWPFLRYLLCQRCMWPKKDNKKKKQKYEENPLQRNLTLEERDLLDEKSDMAYTTGQRSKRNDPR